MENLTYKQQTTLLKKDLIAMINDFTLEPCFDDEVKYRLLVHHIYNYLETHLHHLHDKAMEENLREMFSIVSPSHLSESSFASEPPRKDYRPSNKEVITDGGIDPDRDSGTEYSDVPGSQR